MGSQNSIGVYIKDRLPQIGDLWLIRSLKLFKLSRIRVAIA
ncbi:hypothetical protein SPLC1_S205010 [Arthrospira platensis C1]|nr:hypothetical protein SPLC1_S205010 [Arthrospira platensis C1]